MRTNLNIDWVIDSIQDFKRDTVKWFVRDEGLANSMNEYIEVQREYTKKLNKSTQRCLSSYGDWIGK